MSLATIGRPLFLPLAVMLAGCMVYPKETEKIKDDLAAAMPTDYEVYSTTGGNALLALQESGRLAQLQGKYRESADFYGQAISFSEKLEDKALFSIGDTMDSVQAVTGGNDLAMDYPVLPFERMMLHVLNSFNCLALGDVDGFGVDMRHLERLRELSEKYAVAGVPVESDEVETGYEQARQTASQKSSQLVAASTDFHPVARSSCDNAYVLYLMGLYREMRGDTREALVHYEAIRRLGVSIPAVDSAISACRGKAQAAGEGEVIAFLEEGFVPAKRTNHTVVDCGGYLPDLKMTLPNYGLADCLPYQEGGPLIVLENRRCLASSKNLCDLASLAVKAHEERMDGIVARKALTSGVSTSLIGLNSVVNGTFATNPLHEALLLFCGLFTCPVAEIAYLCSERPDLRSWTLLPRNVQVLRFSLANGRHELLLVSAGKSEKLVVDVKPDAKTVIHCMALPGGLKCSAAVLER